MSLDWVFRDDVDDDGFPTERELIRVRREQEARGFDPFGRPIRRPQTGGDAVGDRPEPPRIPAEGRSQTP